MAIMAETRPLRRGKSVDALKKVGDKNALILCTAARLFWAERKVEKARDWFTRAIKVDGDQGDVWGWWMKFELEYGTQVRVCILIQPSLLMPPIGTPATGY
jgi:pre-mRNA-processing factor 6